MSNLMLTVFIAFVIVLISLALLGISWWFTGRIKIKPGACGRTPRQLQKEKCTEESASCGLCKRGGKKDELLQ
ncbi:hypothetical protein DB41_GL00050 [Neochlamydia sp. TUME1]|uniref:hypothetical protein n=1 Tax=unclassified Neochlamydia TaxID=2643326 RepID=UPI00057DF4FA|nr:MULTISPECIES: hypothetical protein [unclassified Neochlamydia]KIC76264.1 hypothetical protein DB41_GL00050 [Neochlamydia sp. TUME1]BBI17016.1 Putative uncharacterized protein [Neochlamydia sp. S13]